AAGRGDHGFGLAGLAVEALDRIDHTVRIAVVVEGAAGAHVLREVDVAAVGRNRRLADVLLLVGLLHQLDAAAGAGGVVQPELARAQRARGGEVLAGDDVLPVRRPGRVVEQAEVLFGHLARITAVGGDGPDVVAAAAVGGEGDAAAVRRPARLHVPGAAGGDAGGGAAADRHAVEIAEQREHQLAAVGRDVDVHPGAFAGFEADGLRRALGGLDVPFGRFLVALGVPAQAAGAVQRCVGLVGAGGVKRLLLKLDVVAAVAVLRVSAVVLLLRGLGGRRRRRRVLGQRGEGGEYAGESEGKGVACHAAISVWAKPSTIIAAPARGIARKSRSGPASFGDQCPPGRCGI